MGETSTSSRLDWVDRAKALSILLVVLLHTRIELGFLGLDSAVIDTVNQYGITMRMPLFFTVSGLFAGKWIRASWSELFRKRLALLAWVFLIWQPVVFAYKVAEMMFLPDQPDNDWATQIAKTVLAPVRPNGELWFLWALFLFFVLAKSTAALPMWVRLGLPVAISVLWMSFAGVVLPESVERLVGDGWSGVARYYAFFIIAATFGRTIARKVAEVHWASAVGVVAVWLVAVPLLLPVGIPGARFVLSIIGVGAGFGIARLLPIPGLAKIGQRTLAIYVAHIPILVLITIALHAFDVADVAEPLAGVVMLAVAAVAVCGTLALNAMLAQSRWGRYAYEPPQRVMQRDS